MGSIGENLYIQQGRRSYSLRYDANEHATAPKAKYAPRNSTANFTSVKGHHLAKFDRGE